MAKKIITLNNKTFNIYYDIFHSDKDYNIIILHGWGSNKEVMKTAFQNGLEDFKLIFIDMPGFGKSITDEVLTTNDYVNIIDNFLKDSNISKDIIIGHSFGGKVATLLNPNHLILLSTAGIVEEKPLKVRLKIKLFKFLKSIFGDSMYKIFATKDVDNMPKNMYETLKNVVDEDFSQKFKNFKNSATIFWGKDDKAVSLKSGELIHSLIKESKFFPMEGDHYFFLQNSEQIKEYINQSIK
jgi:pimeloyl-ACP methyl ester carboxylesterase